MLEKSALAGIAMETKLNRKDGLVNDVDGRKVRAGDECVFVGDFDKAKPFIVTRVVDSHYDDWYFVDGIFYDGKTISLANNNSIVKTGRVIFDLCDILEKIKVNSSEYRK